MKVGEFKVKRHYSFVQIFIDLASAFMIYLCISSIFWLKESVFSPPMSALYMAYGENIPFSKWGAVIVFPIIAFLIFAASVVLSFLKKIPPSKYVLNEQNAQAYSNIANDTIYLLRLVLLFLCFEGSGIYSDFVLTARSDLFNKTIIFSLCFIALIIYFFRTRLNKIAEKKIESYKK
ncbi:MAG: hypothetical protein GX346_01535 [Clostridiales bacterium]|nr:hypothetical protein [Clostridiales bacterium]